MLDTQDIAQLGSMVEGSNTELLGVRIPASLMSALRKAAQDEGKTVPDMVRVYLTLHAFPGVVQLSLEQLMAGDDEGFENLAPGVAKHRAQLGHLIKQCEKVEVVKGIALKAEEQFTALEDEASRLWRGLAEQSTFQAGRH